MLWANGKWDGFPYLPLNVASNNTSHLWIKYGIYWFALTILMSTVVFLMMITAWYSHVSKNYALKFHKEYLSDGKMVSCEIRTTPLDFFETPRRGSNPPNDGEFGSVPWSKAWKLANAVVAVGRLDIENGLMLRNRVPYINSIYILYIGRLLKIVAILGHECWTIRGCVDLDENTLSNFAQATQLIGGPRQVQVDQTHVLDGTKSCKLAETTIVCHRMWRNGWKDVGNKYERFGWSEGSL